MSDPLRPVAVAPVLRDAIEDPPFNGARVIALGLGGCLAQTVWTSESAEFFAGWMEYPKVSPAIRARIEAMQQQQRATKHNQPQQSTTRHNQHV